MKPIVKAIKEFFIWFDSSETPFTFTHNSATFFSGIISFLYTIAAILFLIGALIPFCKKENFTLHYYTMNLEKTEVLDFNDKSVAFAFGLDCRKEEKTKEAEELFDLYFAYVSRAHERIDQVLDISHFHICTPDDFMSELIDYYEVLGLQKLYCLNKDRLVNYTIQGIFTDDIFEYFYIGVYAKNATEEYYQKINKLLLENDCKLQYYYTDTILDIDNYSTPITYFMDSMFLELNPAAHMKKNIYYLNYHLYNDSSLFNDLDWFRLFKAMDKEPRDQIGLSRTYDYFDYKGENRNEGIRDPSGYATMYIRADNRKIEVERSYQDINEFYGDNYILLDLYYFICFLLGFYTDFFARRSLKHKLFFYENNPENKISKNSIKNLLNGNKENKSYVNDNTLAGFKVDNIDNDTNVNIYNVNNLKNNNNNNTINNINIKNNNIIHKTKDMNTPSDTSSHETSMTKKTKKMYELGCCQRFLNFCFCCCDWNFYHGNHTIYNPDDFIDEKLDIMYYIKNMLLLELINKLKFENKQNFINFLVTPIIESKRCHEGVDSSKIQTEDESEDDDDVDDLYKEANQLEYNQVSEEITNSMKNQQNKDVKLLSFLEDKLNNYNS